MRAAGRSIDRTWARTTGQRYNILGGETLLHGEPAGRGTSGVKSHGRDTTSAEEIIDVHVRHRRKLWPPLPTTAASRRQDAHSRLILRFPRRVSRTASTRCNGRFRGAIESTGYTSRLTGRVPHQGQPGNKAVVRNLVLRPWRQYGLEAGSKPGCFIAMSCLTKGQGGSLYLVCNG
ncbi:hypothetical protein GUJ93_ZPchr0007g3085 [Zizania palustris]|uniref:Arginine decarboxylase n=1 Tax=Zizania palustris TaxID=103762 RepID=A0A8J5W6J9_ZIZPA|nr:hypothetical protein GUJ93_ZPchr0007g3085 [Zizania palustris]